MEDRRYELRGNTLKAYIYVLKNKRVGVRELQRALRLSNPSLAQYHLNKLKDMGLVKENDGSYSVVEEVKVDVMKDFLRFGTLLVPRFVFYAVFFTFFSAYFLIVLFSTFASFPSMLVIYSFIVFASALFWYEAYRAWKSAP